MASSILNSDDGVISGTSGLKSTGGDDGVLLLQSKGTTAFTVASTGNVQVAKAARATLVTDDDGSFDMDAASNFKCTPTGNFTLTFTNITSGQSGNIILVNTGGHTISANAAVKVSATALATISAAGTYWLSYVSDGTSVFVANTGALA